MRSAARGGKEESGFALGTCAERGGLCSGILARSAQTDHVSFCAFVGRMSKSR